MPYFLITVTLKDKSVHSGIRENQTEIDIAYLTFKVHVHKAYGIDNVLHYDCVQLSVQSDEVRKYMKQKGKTGITRYESNPNGIDLPLQEEIRPTESRPNNFYGKYRK